LHASINRDIGRYIKQIVTENCGREKKASVEVSSGPERKDTCERHAWRSRTTCIIIIINILNPIQRTLLGLDRDVIVQFPRHRAGRQTIGGSRYAFRRSLVTPTKSDMCPGRERSPRSKSDTHAYRWLQCTSPFTAICKRQQASRMRRSFSKVSRFTQIFSYVCVCVLSRTGCIFVKNILSFIKTEELIQRGSCLLVSSTRCNLLLFPIRNMNCRDSDLLHRHWKAP